jgi:hypothetical protein
MKLRYLHDLSDSTLGADPSERESDSARDDLPTPVEDADRMLGEWGESDRRMGGGSLAPGTLDGSIPFCSQSALRSTTIFFELYSSNAMWSFWLTSIRSMRSDRAWISVGDPAGSDAGRDKYGNKQIIWRTHLVHPSFYGWTPPMRLEDCKSSSCRDRMCTHA